VTGIGIYGNALAKLLFVTPRGKNTLLDGRISNMTGNGNNYKPDYSVLKQWPVSLWEWPRIAIYVPWPSALPNAADVNPGFIEIARHGTMFMHLPYGFTDRMRNEAAKQFLLSDYTHLLMLDSDHVHPPDIVQKLAKHVIEDPERLIIGGINFKRAAPYSPCAWVYSDKNKDKIYRVHEWEAGLIEVARLGSGCWMIAREAFERTSFPWFVNEPQMENEQLGSHDNYFCKLAIKEGIKIYCDFNVSSPHMGRHRVTEQTYRTFCEVNPIPQEELIDA